MKQFTKNRLYLKKDYGLRYKRKKIKKAAALLRKRAGKGGEDGGFDSRFYLSVGPSDR